MNYVFAALLMALLWLLVQSRARYLPITEAWQRQGGQLVRLTPGQISYEWHGPEAGEIVVLVPGFATPRIIWARTVPALVAAGYRVLCFDHFGRGYSDRCKAKFSRQFFIDELDELTQLLIGKDTPINLIGTSMGSGIAVNFAAEYPERIKRLILTAPVGFMPAFSGRSRLLKWPWVGETLLALYGSNELIDALHCPRKEQDNPMREKFQEQFYIRGTPTAIASTMRYYPIANLRNDYQRLQHTAFDLTAIWADDDALIPPSALHEFRQTVPKARVIKVPDASHDFVYTAANVTNPLLISALKS